MAAKKKPGLSPEAAKILEQYRKSSVGGVPSNRDGSNPVSDEGGPNRQDSPPPTQIARRSGTRGK